MFERRIAVRILGLALALQGLVSVHAAPASAATGTSPLHLVLGPANATVTVTLTKGVPAAVPAGIVTFGGQTAADATATAQMRLGPCGAVPTSGPVDLVVRPGRFASNTRLVPDGWCGVADLDMALTVSIQATVTTDAAKPVYVDTPDVALPPITTTAGRPEYPLDLGALVPNDALAVVLIATASLPVGAADAAKVAPCTDATGLPSTGIGTGGTRASLVLAQFSTASAFLPHQVCLEPAQQVDGTFPMTFTLAGYVAPSGGSATYTLPEFRYQGLSAPSFVPRTPTRLFDTRDGGTPVAAGEVHRLDLTSLDPLVSALVLNVTVTEPQGPGYVTVYPCDVAPPTASSLNYVANQTIANQVTVGLLQSRTLCFFTQSRAHLVADLAGTYDSRRGDGFEPVTPSRLFDTRTSGARVTAGSVYHLDLHGTVPDDASAVSMNVTVTETVNPGYITVFPCDESQPTASNLNYAVGATVPNLVTVKIGASRQVCFYAHGTTHLFADLSGWYRPGVVGGFIDNVPDRVFDTRTDLTDRIQAGKGVFVTWNDDVDAVVLNVTVTDPLAPGFVTVYPCDAGRPEASNLNFVAHQTVPNAVVVKADASKRDCFYAHAATHLIADITGYFYGGLDFAYLNVPV